MTGESFPPVIVILGATAVGKTGLGIELAQHFGGEILSADSRQIYRQMDIGTAKPSTAQLAQVPHHLIDIVNPNDTLTAAEYQDLAYTRLDELHTRGILPFIVGGTGQYISAVVEGWQMPRVSPNWTLRAELEAMAQTQGYQALYQRLAALDAEAASKIHPNNVRRVIRALEVCLETGKPMSEQQRKQAPPYRFYTIGLTMPRDRLYARADQRLDDMMTAGLLEEVHGLLERGYKRELPAMTGLGYLELTTHLLDGVPLTEALQRAKYNTHDFIRRQDIWFRGHDHGILWHNIETLNSATLIETIEAWR